jgi:flagellar basal-body rod modification protein FlgD
VTAPVSGTSNTTTNSSPFTQAAGGKMGKDEFIKLLVAQMTHQDPLAPSDGQQMASQLAQFSSVEQLMNIGTKLDEQGTTNTGLVTAVNNSAAMNLLGKTVTATSDTITVGGAKPTGAVVVDVPSQGGTLQLKLTDSTGKVVKTVDLGTKSGGAQRIALADYTKDLPAGTYGVAVASASGGAKAVNLTTMVTAVVDGVRFGTNGAVVTSGDRTFPISTISAIDATN